MNKKIVLCDTNIFVKIFRGDEIVLEQLENIGVDYVAISPIIKCELYNGSRNKQDLKKVKTYLSAYTNYHISTEISKKFQELITTYGYSKNLKVPDALIAATSIVEGLYLWTFNISDFDFIEEIRFYKP